MSEANMPRILCRVCRRIGERLCARAKCASIRKPYPPGSRPRGRRRTQSEYGRQLAEKQKTKALYGLGERQLRRYVETALARRSETAEAFLAQLEGRLDTAVWRLGFALSLAEARQLVSHGHFLVNGTRVTIPSRAVRPGEEITIRTLSLARVPFSSLAERLKKHTPPAWLALKRETATGTVLRPASSKDLGIIPVNIQTVLEFYSR